ncbi:MAG: PilN domain-containing protein [Selenomonadaceae bacterium]|nr:PilN domain-containing protein [Selenomonadaceae bacterium]MBQ1509419.1 PilN domain-containing protein [Selenomonadaceae bacterium]MBQ1915078.1 PilN domain-containing protein [Selenomonadaceae bacterium]
MEMLAALKRTFRKIPQSSIGISRKGDKIFLAWLDRVEGEWQLSAMEELQLSMDAEEEKETAELVRMHCAKNGWRMESFTICIPEEDSFTGSVELPELEEQALAEAIHWEIEGQDIFGERDFCEAFTKIGEGEEYWFSAMEAAEKVEWEKAWNEQEMEPPQFVAMPPIQESLCWGEGCLVLADREIPLGKNLSASDVPADSIEAIYASMFGAGLLRKESCASFSHGTVVDAWNWKALCLTVAGFAVICLAVVTGMDLWQLHSARDDKAAVHREWMLLGKEQQQKDMIERSIHETEQRDSLLAGLSRESFPWYGLLVHFGSMTVEGVCIRDIALSEQDLLTMEGEAVTFSALAEFLKKFEEDKDFFPSAPVLMDSSVEKSGAGGDMVRFSLQLKL